jgi:hypothetical protein
MQSIPKYRILKNLSYIPRKPHGFYYNPTTGGTIKMKYNSDPQKSYTRNVIDPYFYQKHHDRITAITRKQDGFLTKKDAIQIWSFVKIMTRSILNRTYELLLSNKSFIINHKPYLKEILKSNEEIIMEPFKDFKKDVKGHLKTIQNQTEFMLKHLGYYKKSILYIMKLCIKNREIYLKTSHFINIYFNNIISIMTNLRKNISNIEKNTDNYVNAVSEYNQKHYRASRRTIKPSENIREKDKKKVTNAFYKLKNAGNREFKVLLQMIKLSERQENSAEMEKYKQIISRSNQKIP